MGKNQSSPVGARPGSRFSARAVGDVSMGMTGENPTGRYTLICQEVDEFCRLANVPTERGKPACLRSGRPNSRSPGQGGRTILSKHQLAGSV